ncbi:putative membrane protein [Xenococcus sp. PCC 7305]|nr:putative membrane protein [Xenococcus sp. PCC 7305]
MIYRLLGRTIAPLQLNILKGLIAIAMLLVTLMFQGWQWGVVSFNGLLVLAFSGILGIGLGDTAFFTALNHLGPRRTLLLETLAPPMGAFLAFILIGERLSYFAWCGILLTILGVAWVISEGTLDTEKDKSSLLLGFFWGLGAAIAQASGAVLSRMVLLDSNLSSLESSLIRLTAGFAITLLLWLLPLPLPKLKSVTKLESFSLRLWGTLAIATFFGTYLGIWLQQTSLKFAPAGIAQTLLATSPLFIIPMVVMRGEKVSWRSLGGVLLSIMGISLLFLR